MREVEKMLHISLLNWVIRKLWRRRLLRVGVYSSQTEWDWSAEEIVDYVLNDGLEVEDAQTNTPASP